MAFCVEMNRGGATAQVTGVEFIRILNDPVVKEKICKIRGIVSEIHKLEKSSDPEAAKDNIKLFRGEMSKTKASLPGFIFSAQNFEPSVWIDSKKKNHGEARWRKQEHVILNGLTMIDIDHVDDPASFFKEKTQGKDLKNLGILFAFITPSGEGIKIVFKARKEWGNLISNQNKMAKELGVTIDTSTKDAARLSFVSTNNDVLFLDQDELINYYSLEYDQAYRKAYNDGVTESDLFPDDPAEATKASTEAPKDENEAFEKYTYKGIAIEDIMEKWMNGQKPDVGQRHKTLLRLVRELRYVCDRKPDLVRYYVHKLDWVQDLIKENDPVEKTIDDGLNYRMYENMPDRMSAAVKSFSKPLFDDKAIPDEFEPFIKWGKEIEKYFDVYPCLREVCSKLESSSYPAVLFSSAAFFGTLMTRTWYHYYHLPELERRLNYSIYVIGDPGSGKSAIGWLYSLILEPIISADAVANEAINAYKKQISENDTKSDKAKKEGIKYPDVKVRIHGTRTANGVFIEDMKNCKEVVGDKMMSLHLFTFDAELDSITSASKGGQWIDKSTMELKAFHNEEDNQQYKNKDSVTGPFNVYWNFVYTGTPISLSRKVNERNFGTGLFSRLAVIPIVGDYFKMMSYQKVTKSEEKANALIREWAYKLDKVAGELPVTPLVQNAWNFTDKNMKLAELEGSKALSLLLRRVGYYGINVATPYILMRHFKEWEETRTFKIDKTDIDFSTMIMEIQLYSQKVFFGRFAEMYFDNKLEDESNRSKTSIGNKTSSWLNQMPNEFTSEDVIKLTGKTKESAYVLIWRWTKSGSIKAISRNKHKLYQKIVK